MGDSNLIVNTPSGKGARTDEGRIRAAAVMHGVPCITTLEGALAAIGAMEALHQQSLTIQAVQDRFPAKTRVSGRSRNGHARQRTIALTGRLTVAVGVHQFMSDRVAAQFLRGLPHRRQNGPTNVLEQVGGGPTDFAQAGGVRKAGAWR